MQGERAIKKSLNLQFDGRFIGKLAFYQFTLISKFRRLVQVGQFSYFQPWKGKVKSCKKQQNSAHKKLRGLGRGTVYDRRRYKSGVNYTQSDSSTAETTTQQQQKRRNMEHGAEKRVSV